MSNSPMVDMTKLSPEYTKGRTHTIDRITPHYVAGPLKAANIAACFPAGRKASCNYAIGSDKKIALVVNEDDRSWCSSSSANDNRSVTIECANNTDSSLCDGVYEKLIELCTDICKRHGKRKLLWIPDKDKALAYVPKTEEMLLTVHRWFASTSCPGEWMMQHMADLAQKVTDRLAPAAEVPKKSTIYRVKISWLAAEQKGAFTVLENAKACADNYPGYTVYDDNGNAVYTSETTDLRKGTSGQAVKELQEDLILCGYDCGAAGADGDFGTATLAAVKTFQAENGLTVDGVCGDKTKAKLMEFKRVVLLYTARKKS